MKKQLLAGTAIVAASVLIAGGAVAADKKMMKPSISVGGYYSAHGSGILDEDSQTQNINHSAFDVRTDSEIHFKGSAALDNGVKISVRWELEGDSHTSAGNPSPANGNDQIDDMWLSVSGSFGQVTVGATDNATTKMLHRYTGAWATNVGQNFHFNSAEWIASAPGGGAGKFHVMQDARIREHRGGGDAEKVIYISPKFGGFQIGASYTPQDKQHWNVLVDTEAADYGHDGLSGAISYSGKFSGVGIGGGAGVQMMQDYEGSEDWESWGAAVSLAFGGGFRVAIAHERTTSPMRLEGSVTEGGVRYTAGANSFSVVGSHGELDNSGDMYSAAKLAYSRSLGPGVSVNANLFFNRSENDDGQENSGTVFTTGIVVGF